MIVLNGANTITDIIEELRHIQREMSKGSNALYEAEKQVAEAEYAYERALALAFLAAEGKTAGERTAMSKFEASQERLDADLAKAVLNRVKSKMKTLELQQMGTQTISRLVETELKVLR